MKLTQSERWILSNQCRILELLDRENASHWTTAKEAIDSGYELEYSSLSKYIDSEVVTEEECREVFDILLMFDTLQHAYKNLPDKSGIEEWRIKFAGFDGNNEVKQMAYARYYCNLDGGRFVNLDRGDNFNSHSPVLDRYRSMLSEWKKSEKKHELTKDDIARITDQGIKKGTPE